MYARRSSGKSIYHMSDEINVGSSSPRLSVSRCALHSRKNIFNDKTRIENDKLKKEEEKRKISVVVGKQFRGARKSCFSFPDSFTL
jgi:hypothetical protein